MNYDNPRGPGDPPYGKGIGAEATIALLYDQNNHPQNSFNSAYSSQLENRTLILEATNGTFHTFTTVSGLTTYEGFIQNLTNQINNHPLFTAQYTLVIFGQTKGRFHLINIQQYLPGLAGNTVFGTFLAYAPSDQVNDEQRTQLIEQLREVVEKHSAGSLISITDIRQLLVMRYLGQRAHQCKNLFIELWKLVRPLYIEKQGVQPRIWFT